MTRREMVLTVVGVFVVSLVARAYFAAQIVFPKPEDTAYYVGVARNLLRKSYRPSGGALLFTDGTDGAEHET